MPRVGVHVITLNEAGEVLLVRRNYLNHDWIPPGGMMEDGESLQSAASRELLEETGYEVKPGVLVAVASRPRTNDVIVVFEGKITGRQAVEIGPDEISSIGFFSFEKLPEPMMREARALLELYKSGERGKVLEI